MHTEEIIRRFCACLNHLGHTEKWKPKNEKIQHYVTCMTDPRRQFHSLEKYVGGLLVFLDTHSHYFNDMFEIEAAIFLHRFMWIPGTPESTEWCCTEAEVFLEGQALRDVRALIRVAESDASVGKDLDFKMGFMRDLPLVFLGQDQGRFQEDFTNLVREYVSLSPVAVGAIKNVRKIFQDTHGYLKETGTVFITPFLQEDFGETASYNIRFALENCC